MTARRIDLSTKLRGHRAANPAAFFTALALAVSPAGSFIAHAVEVPLSKLLFSPSPTLPTDGAYLAGDQIFMVSHLAGQVRLRFAGNDEVFYLTSEPASMGGRVLKYDNGEVALQVAGWGGITLYTEAMKSGVPAERSEETMNFDPKPMAAKDFMPFVAKLAEGLAAHDDLAVGFAADWEVLQKSDKERALACDAMRNAAAGIEWAVKNTKRGAIADGLHIVKVAPSAKAGVAVKGGVLIVSYTTQGGPSARPSSRAVAQALEAAF